MKKYVATFILAGVIGFSSSGPALAASESGIDGYPAKPITFHVGYAAGGSADTIARIVMPKLGERLGQTIVVDNRAGAGGIIGLDLVRRARPDGYVLGFGTAGSLGSIVHLVPDLPYDPLKDFVPISLVINNPLVLVVRADKNIESVSGLIEVAKSGHPLFYGSVGTGSATNLAGELLNQMAGISMTHVPFKGSTPAELALLGGHVDAAVLDVLTVKANVAAGKLRILGVTSPSRSPLIPDVPTIAEAGLPGYSVMSWFGIVAPAQTPKPLIQKLNKELIAVLGEPTIRERIQNAGGEPLPTSPDEMSEVIRAEIQSTGKIIKAANISISK